MPGGGELKNGDDSETAGSLRGGRRQGFALRAGEAVLDRARCSGSEVITRLLTQPLRSLNTGLQTKLVIAPEDRKLTQDSTYKLMGIRVQATCNKGHH